MKQIWIQFTWDLAALPEIQTELPEHYQIVPATAADQSELRKVISSSFALDPAWNPSMQEMTQTIDVWLDRAVGGESSVCLVLRHGLRIIGATILTMEPDAPNHLSPGPCVLVEYRNRGFGTHLLDRSLRTLQEAGLVAARGMAKENSPATKFLYWKFSSTPIPHDFSPPLAA